MGMAAPLLGRAEWNRLVAAELERRWDQALQRVRTIENQIALHMRGQGVEVVPTRPVSN